MSASSKKELRKGEKIAKLTERQEKERRLAEEKRQAKEKRLAKERNDAKKLKIYSIIFTVVIVAVMVTAIAVMGYKAVDNSGLVQKLTTALTVGDHKINSVEMNYYYMDAVTKTYNQWESSFGESLPTYLSLMGLDLTQPLDEQAYDEEQTWADYFMDLAVENAQSDYVLADAAEQADFTLPEDRALSLQSEIGSIEMQSMLNGYPNVDMFISNYYGKGASYDSYVEYLNRGTLANAFYNDKNDNLTYTAEEINAKLAAKPNDYHSFSYAEYTLSSTSFMVEHAEGEENHTHTAEETDAANAAAKAAADKLAQATSLEALNAAIAKLDINKDAENTPAATVHENVLYTSLGASYQEWLTAEGRKAGDIGVIEVTSTSTDEDGNETSTVTGYTVVLFTALNENGDKMSNVRHLLVCPVAEDHEETGEEIVTDEAWQVAKDTAEMHLEEWKKSDGTQEGFIELVKESSEDEGSVENGGLYENIHRDSPYEEEFLKWAIDPARTKDETGIIKTSYGYHIMYYVGNTEMSYRDYMITETLRAAELETWFNDTKNAQEVTRKDLSLIDTSSILFAASNG